MNVDKGELFFIILCQQLTNLGMDYGLNDIEICASWCGIDGDYSKTHHVVLRDNEVMARLKELESHVSDSRVYPSNVKHAMLEKIRNFFGDHEDTTVIDVDLPVGTTEEELGWF